jgi:O-antigen/teichoic acid export membrane protein
MNSLLTTFVEKKFNIDAKYFISGGFWLSVAQLVALLSGIITTALFAQLLSQSSYGIYRYFFSILTIFSSFCLTGIGQSIIQTSARKFYSFYTETLAINLYYGVGIFFSGLTGAAYYYLNGNTVLAGGCLVIAILQPLINSFQNTPLYLQGAQKFKEATIIQITRTLFIAVLTVSVLFFTKNILFLFSTYLLSSLLINLITHSIYKPESYKKTPTEVFEKYINYAKHTSFRNIISNLTARIDTVIIFTQLGAIPLAIYSIAIVVPEQIKATLKNLAALLLPKYAQHEDKQKLYKSVYKRSFHLFLLLIAVTILYVAAAPYIYAIIFPKYVTAVALSQIIALSFPAMVALLPSSALQTQLEERKLYHLQWVETVLTFVLMPTLTVVYGLMGAVAAKVLIRYFATIYSFIIIRL